MYGLPENIQIKKIIPKSKIFIAYKQELSPKRKKNFDAEISRITVIAEISPFSLNVSEGDIISSIFIVKINIKTEKITDSNISMVTNFFGQNILFIIERENQVKLAIYQSKIIQTDFMDIEDMKIKIDGLNLDTIWENLVLFVSGYELQEGNTLNQQIELEDEKNKLINKIGKLGKMARKEKQPKKGFELHQEMRKLEKRLEEL